MVIVIIVCILYLRDCTACSSSSQCSYKLPVYGHLSQRSVYSVYTNLLGVGFHVPSILGDSAMPTMLSGTCLNVDNSQP